SVLLRRVLPQVQARCTSFARETARAPRRRLSTGEGKGPPTLRALQLPTNRHHVLGAGPKNGQRRRPLSPIASEINALSHQNVCVIRKSSRRIHHRPHHNQESSQGSCHA